MDDLDPGILKRGQPLLRVVTGRVYDLHAAIDDGADIARVVRGSARGQEGQVKPKGLSVMALQRAISAARAAGVGCAADDSSANPTKCMPPWTL